MPIKTIAIKLISLLLLSIPFQIVKGQKLVYNIYEINKGEILKNNYAHLEAINTNLFIATPFSDNINYDYADTTGVIDINENIKIPFKYRNIQRVKDQYGLYKKENTLIALSNSRSTALMKYENDQFKKLTDFGYFKFRPFLFNGDYLSVEKSRCEILDLNTDSIILKTNFLELKPLTNNLISTKEHLNHHYGIINKKGDTILNNNYNKIWPISGQFICYSKRDSNKVYVGLVNNDEEIIFPPIFLNIKLSNNRILAQTFNTGKPITINQNITNDLNKWKLDVKKNNKIITTINSIDKTEIQQMGYYGAFDSDGNQKIPFEYEILKQGVKNEIIASKNGKYGIISENGAIIADFKYDEITTLFDSFYLAKNSLNTHLIALNNKILIKENVKKIFPISDHEVLYLLDNTWYKKKFTNGFKNSETSKTNLNPNFNFNYLKTFFKKGYKINTDYFIVQIGEFNRYGIMNKDLKIIIGTTNSQTSEYFNGKYFDLGSIYTLDGVKLDNISIDKNDETTRKSSIIVQKGNQTGVIDLKGKTIIPFAYHAITPIDESKFIIIKELK